MQMCLAPLWKAYEVLESGTDVAASLSRMLDKLSLKQVNCPLQAACISEFSLSANISAHS